MVVTSMGAMSLHRVGAEILREKILNEKVPQCMPLWAMYRVASGGERFRENCGLRFFY